jgi:hypothetical protein
MVPFNEVQMAYLARRIEGVRQLEAGQQPSQQQVDEVVLDRPILPTNNTPVWNEVEGDHRLICNWHEQAWQSLARDAEPM